MTLLSYKYKAKYSNQSSWKWREIKHLKVTTGKNIIVSTWGRVQFVDCI